VRTNMTNKNQEQEKFRFRDSQNDVLDRALDAALAKYAVVEPRMGIEDRILINLRTQRVRIANHVWRWSLAAALAVVVVAAVIDWRSGTPSRPVTANYLTTAQPAPLPATETANRYASTIQPKTDQTRKLAPLRQALARSSQPQAVVVELPKLDVFPSPQPLNEQEKIMARYLANYPEQAALIAQARMQALQRDEAERMSLAESDHNSEQ
jgi:hypothetical protein